MLLSGGSAAQSQSHAGTTQVSILLHIQARSGLALLPVESHHNTLARPDGSRAVLHRSPGSKWSPRPPAPASAAGPALGRAAPRPSNDGGRVSPRPLPSPNRLSPRPSNDDRASPGGRVSPIGGRVSPLGGRVSPVGGGNYPSAAKVVADAHAAQVQRQKALAAQQAQRQQARASLEEEKRRLALVSHCSCATARGAAVLLFGQLELRRCASWRSYDAGYILYPKPCP